MCRLGERRVLGDTLASIAQGFGSERAEPHACTCRLDAFPSTSADTVVKVAYITFFKTLAEAQAFADMGSQFPATPEPTATPTPTPTPDVTATPEPTDAPTEKPTEAPTPEPKKTGCGNVIGGTFAVIALAACALVIRKKH